MALRPFALQRPFVVLSPSPIHIHRGEEASFLIDLPVSVHWQAESTDILAHPNTIDLPKTWFGDTTAGRLCFLWACDLQPPRVPPFGSLFRCHIIVRNFAKTPLVLKQFAIYCEYLSLWDLGNTLGTDTVFLEGLPDGSLKMGVLPNEQSRQGVPLYEATVGQTELLLQKGVDFLRAITGID